MIPSRFSLPEFNLNRHSWLLDGFDVNALYLGHSPYLWSTTWVCIGWVPDGAEKSPLGSYPSPDCSG